MTSIALSSPAPRALAIACLTALGAAWLIGCAGREAGPVQPAAPPDIHSWASPDVRVVHMDLAWMVQFDQRILDGDVTYHLERSTPTAGPLRLDARGLEILGAEAGVQDAMQETTWNLGPEDPVKGSELTVDLPEGADRARVRYRTSPDASGLQWLSPEQTSGSHPFLYTQSQAIHARTWIPCQDSPAVRVTFDATVRVPPPLRAVMAARDVTAPDAAPGAFRYSMTRSIPSYLIALAVGDLAFGSIGPRTGIWAEPAMLERAVAEFADMEAMLTTAERLYGPYRWERYDLLVLPPSFPFGGMENPMLTFATPTILAGDRSLVSLVAHELAHSWSGNLVTNATWSDFWLNEGFTTYVERRIMEQVFSVDRARMEWVLGRQDLEAEIADTLKDKPGDQILVVDLTGRDPDDAFSNIPYEKGSHLLLLLERTYGRDAFDPFLRAWFDEHAFRSVTTADFRAFLDERLASKGAAEGRAAPDLEAWLKQPGLPDSVPLVESGEFAKVDAALASWGSGIAPADLPTQGWTTHHWRHFLRSLPSDLDATRLAGLDAAFGFTKTGNAEVLQEWLVIAVRHGYEPAWARLDQFLTGMGRRKFLTPLYREMVKTEEGRAMAQDIYARARPMYHAISRRTLDPIVGWSDVAQGASGEAAP